MFTVQAYTASKRARALLLCVSWCAVHAAQFMGAFVSRMLCCACYAVHNVDAHPADSGHDSNRQWQIKGPDSAHSMAAY